MVLVKMIDNDRIDFCLLKYTSQNSRAVPRAIRGIHDEVLPVEILKPQPFFSGTGIIGVERSDKSFTAHSKNAKCTGIHGWPQYRNV